MLRNQRGVLPHLGNRRAGKPDQLVGSAFSEVASGQRREENAVSIRFKGNID